MKLAEVEMELRTLWDYFTNKELCQHYNICSNTLWHWKSKLNLPNKKMGRPDHEVINEIKKGDKVIFLGYPNIGHVMEVLGDKVLIHSDGHPELDEWKDVSSVRLFIK